MDEWDYFRMNLSMVCGDLETSFRKVEKFTADAISFAAFFPRKAR